MDTKQILEKKQRGDILTVAQILEIEYHNADKALKRPNSKYHASAIRVLEKIITDREQSINQSRELVHELV